MSAHFDGRGALLGVPGDRSPSEVLSAVLKGHRMIHLKSPEELEIMDRANRIVHKVLQRVSSEVAPGVALRELDAVAESTTKSLGGKPAFKGYHGYPASICISVNDEVVHGIPGERKLQEGDIVSLDFGAILDGYYGDAACTVPVGEVDEGLAKLMEVTRESLLKGIERAAVGQPGVRCVPRRADLGGGARFLGGARLRGARHRPGPPRGAPGSQFRRPRASARSCGRAWSWPSSP